MKNIFSILAIATLAVASSVAAQEALPVVGAEASIIVAAPAATVETVAPVAPMEGVAPVGVAATPTDNGEEALWKEGKCKHHRKHKHYKKNKHYKKHKHHKKYGKYSKYKKHGKHGKHKHSCCIKYVTVNSVPERKHMPAEYPPIMMAKEGNSAAFEQLAPPLPTPATL